ncbi:pantoate--beta-alanine ligase [Fibrisoma montanum]|uniref:Pantothenate synthetase n=1 Tax=Fibrisoma montanum TaxID=2305895 RepID=A0A418LYM9_9BACT|nr:pantoate--beta-alanine ligase [Fibrisoma montanum]RIV18464.1 pantoate--beta-alanine ligase [Fibrisoma montanum]
MHYFDTIAALRSFFHTSRTTHQLGLVPTMGALHDGHLTLVEAARHQSDLVVTSIFVNPVQFNNPDDLARYPRTLEADLEALEAAGCDVVFAPSVDEMYAEPPLLRLHFGELETVMEGAFRPGHFNGVGIVVAKLFNIVQPDRAFFGQKDLQQVAVVRRLIRDLSFPVELIRCPTIREADGLAMSSRNRNLTPEERELAPALYQALTLAHDLLAEGQSPAQAKAAVTGYFATRPGFQLEYIEVANADTLQPVAEVLAPGQTAVCIAAHLGNVRLIDNVVF